MTDENITKAIQYGITSKQEKRTLYQLVDPWLVAEKALKNPYRQKESVFVYTPYLLAAIHARDKVEESRMPELSDIKKAIQDKYDEIKAYSVKDGGLKEFSLTLGSLTDDERSIIIDGCLINHNRT